MNTIKEKILVLISVSTFLMFSSCETEFFADCISGDGNITTRSIELPGDFTGIEISPEVDVVLSNGKELKLTFTSDANIIDAIEADSKLENGVFKMGIEGCINNFTDIDLQATIPNLHFLGVNGKANIKTEGIYNLHNENLVVDISGAANVELSLGTLNSFLFKVSGNGDLDHISGKADNFTISIDGDGDVKGFDLDAKDCEIRINGQGDCEVKASETLDITINGDGNVCYLGNPIVNQNINGDGQVSDCN